MFYKLNKSREVRNSDETMARKPTKKTTTTNPVGEGSSTNNKRAEVGETEEGNEQDGVVKSKYGGRYDSDEEDEIDYTTDKRTGRKSQSRSSRPKAAGASKTPVRDPASKPIGSKSMGAITAKRSQHRSYENRRTENNNNPNNNNNDDDYEDLDDGVDVSDNTSLNNDRSPRSKASRKRYLDMISPAARSRQNTKSKIYSDTGGGLVLGGNENEENTVRLVIKPDPISGNSSLARKRYASLFDKQRLILKSLYEIRRCRINNRDVN